MKKSITLSFCLLAFLFSFAQGKQSIDFSSAKGSAKKQLFSIPVAVKLSALEAAFGGQSLFMEFGVSDIFTIEAGVGVNFTPLLSGSKNFYSKYSNGFGQGFTGFGAASSGYSDTEGFVPFEKMNRELGYHGSLTLKLSPSGEGDLTGGYYALNFRYSNFNYASPRIVPGYYYYSDEIVYSSVLEKTSVTAIDGIFRYGYQFRIDNVLLDFGLGFGIRVFDGQHNGYNGSFGGTMTPAVKDFNKTMLLYEGVFKVGYLLSE